MTILQHGIAQAAGGGGYQIARSLRFNQPDSAYLSKTLGSGNRDKWTLSLWFKITRVDNFSNVPTLFAADSSATDAIQFNSSGQLEIITGGATTRLVTNRVFRDVASYMHLVVTADTTNATTANKLNIYSNGVVNTYATDNRSGLTTNSFKINSAIGHALGSNLAATSRVCDMYLADIRFIDGQALDPTSFGEFDANTGVWSPKTYAGTYGTNGFWLKLDDNSGVTATTLGKDSSGNSNNWTPSNFSITAGVGNDSLVDSPTNYGTDTGAGGEVRGNYCTWNPLSNTASGLANGNLDLTASGPMTRANSTIAVSSGKWYYEVRLNTAGTNSSAGIGQNFVTDSYPGYDALSYAFEIDNARIANNNTLTAYGSACTAGDTFMCAIDLDNNKIFFGKNGTWFNSSNPATGTSPAFTITAGTYCPIARPYGGSASISANFGQRPFAYTAPSGFKALCTQNLPTPAIGATSSTLASKNFNVVAWSGTDGSDRTITGVGFQPDLVWAKSRSDAYSHTLFDAVRGAGANKELMSDSTGAEGSTGSTATNGFVSGFTSDGFSTDNGSANTSLYFNAAGKTYVAWNWKGGNGTVSNTSGSITSTVSANPTAGISILTYTGTGTGGATIGHGLGVAPKMIITKARVATGLNWAVYHASLGATKNLWLSLSDAVNTQTVIWNDTAPTSSVFTVGSAGNTNSTQGMVAYCFAEVAGFSKISSYTGNGSSDGAFVYCGFRPRYLILKSTGSNGWITIDAVRNSYNVSNSTLFPHASAAEDSSGTFPTIDFLSNGFKMRNAANEGNASGATYIFAAFAEAPFNYARAR